MLKLDTSKIKILDLQAFTDYLNDEYGHCSIAGSEYLTSCALKRTDPTTYAYLYNCWIVKQKTRSQTLIPQPR